MRLLRPFAFLASLLFAAAAFGHPADEEYTLTVTADLLDGKDDAPADAVRGPRLQTTVYIPTWFLMDEVFSEGTLMRDLLGKDADTKAQIAGWMAYQNPVLADGEAIQPVVLSLEARSANWPDNQPFPGFAKDLQTKEDDDFTRRSSGVKMVLAYPFKQMPRTLSVRWRRHMNKPLPEGGVMQPPVTLAFFFDGKHRIQDLTAQEPEWVWHSDAVAEAPASARVVQALKRDLLEIPVLLLTVAFGGMATALFLRLKRKKAASLVVAIVTLGLATALGFTNIGVITTDSPFKKQLARPNPAEARIIFDGLLRGVYKAFDYNKDAQIYDALAQCVDGPILEKIYKDVHGALVLDDTEGGGAVCQVEEVKVDKAGLVPVQDGAGDAVVLNCAWTVRGKVSHWGHTHVRANAYAAKVTLAPRQGKDGPMWKITACEVTEQTPIEVK